MTQSPSVAPLALLPDDLSPQVSQSVLCETENYLLEGHIFGYDTLFVTFEPAGGIGRTTSRYRHGWGATMFRQKGISCFCVKPKRKDWYTRPDLGQAFHRLRPFLDQFDRVIAYGGSMGGFGALAYGDAMGADTIISINPQSTLDPSKAPWEDRYPVARTLDFSADFADAVGKYGTVRQVLIFSDRHYDYDERHTERLRAPNVTVINTPFVEHHVPEHLQRIRALGYIVTSVHDDTFDPQVFYSKMRGRRTLRRYADVMLSKTEGRPHLHRIVQDHVARTRLIG
jgi:hypothetical protein